ncbi:hypothetical protein PGT21_033773 [Puccinia graminis f. sp. tritici]|uniref:SAM domain-containing protein n=1 Tax=Puccinia graminis f. sp. tritici TaxID=56615 RepID=A0A5B0M198_PUCGR|nr:hypothetical protein PGT21_033773 [Puccinia graminis f. sp. tritici]
MTAGIHVGACRIEIFMEKPTRMIESMLSTPPASGRAVRFIDEDHRNSHPMHIDSDSLSLPDLSAQIPASKKRSVEFDGVEDVVSKRFKAFQQSELSSSRCAITMLDFLQFCRIPLDDDHTRSIIQEHRLHHWTVFIDLSADDLNDLGFSRGPILLFLRGVARLIHGKHEYEP